MEINFEELERARKTPRRGYPKGHRVKDLCEKIGLSVSAYHKLKTNKETGTKKPHRMTVKAIERYIRAAEKVRARAED